jgi:diacylglycerol kinase family enzyme
MTRRLAAGAALLLGLTGIVIAAILAVDDFPEAVPAPLCIAAAALAAWRAVTHRGTQRILGLAAAVLLLAAGLVLVIVHGRAVENALMVLAFALSLGAARVAFAARVSLPRAPNPSHPVLVMNPRSGGGKAERFHLADEAGKRGIEAVELHPGDDLQQIVHTAIADGADGLAMAGGDGSQAIVARIAAEHRLPYACIPAGTRNHFALDLGVDRDDVVGALDAFVDGGERLVDLAEVNGRVFVNNVSLGVYAEAVQKPGYREAKMRTILDTLPDALDADGGDSGLRWTRPDDGGPGAAAAILVSNNPYRLGRAIGSGTRPHVDTGLLGVAALDTPGDHHGLRRPWREWTVERFEVDSAERVKAGIDGEAAELSPPLTFTIRPRVLRVRVARSHPGASPSAGLPRGAPATIGALVRLALGGTSRPGAAA